MRKYSSLLLALLWPFFTAAQNIRLLIQSLPAKHPAGASLYLAGSFNQWNPEDERYRFQTDAAGHYSLSVSLPPGTYAYKITRGGWERVECSPSGAAIANRELRTTVDTLVPITIAAWQDQVAAPPKRSTASPQVSIVDTAFLIPELNRKRTIRIYLPPGYAQSQKRYPVMYMHDGQNLFDELTSYAGEWGVDEMLDTALFRQCIVVGIDNGGAFRMQEYCPFDFLLEEGKDRKYTGEGKQYARFLATRLKPFIDQRYRTLSSAKNTFVGGSSMGGLISLYTVLAYPKRFGGAAVLSPSIWIARKEISEQIQSSGRKIKSRIFFYAGKKESREMVSDMLKVFDQLMKTSKARMTTVIRDEGRHHESAWRRELPLIFEWLLRD